MSKDFVLPIVECTESSQDYGRIVAAPLEKGFGVTLGNTLRRILLSSLPGAAVTWIKIDGVEHEFSTIPDVKEDTLQFIQNIKGLRFRFLSDRPGKLMLNVSGQGIVTGADIKTTADYELVNPGLYLATMDSKNSKLSVEMNVETGRGYLPADHSDEGLSVGSIPIDAIFSPVRKVDYKVEPTRVGQESTYEKLVLEVWTDLSVSAVEALSQAAQIMIDQLSNFAELVKVSIKAAEKQMLQSYLPPDQFNKPVGEIGFSTRTLNCLRRGGITILGELLSKSESDLNQLRHFGQKSRDELMQRLQELGFSLMSEGEEKPPVIISELEKLKELGVLTVTEDESEEPVSEDTGDKEEEPASE